MDEESERGWWDRELLGVFRQMILESQAEFAPGSYRKAVN
jgi:hypothetical protein